MKDKLVLLEEYLDGLLSKQERILFEEILRNDPELMKEFRLRKNVNKALQEKDIVELRDTLDIILGYVSKSKKIYRNPLFISSAAASIALIITFSWISFFSSPKVTSQELFVGNYLKYPAVSCFRSNTHIAKKDLLIFFAFEAYESNDYAKSQEYLYKLRKTDNSNYMIEFYLALCELELNNLDQSEKLLTELINAQNHVFLEQSYWYLGLLYLKQDNIEKAKEVFEFIVKEGMVKKIEAKKILKSLK
jgi:tetratricopeptide (TPR) repeat protein